MRSPVVAAATAEAAGLRALSAADSGLFSESRHQSAWPADHERPKTNRKVKGVPRTGRHRWTAGSGDAAQAVLGRDLVTNACGDESVGADVGIAQVDAHDE